jgi:dienelactone hydrolase
VTEHAVLFGTASALVGVITDTAGANGEPRKDAVILLNAGLLHRVGPNRLCVELARLLAAAGVTTLRFDFSGIGDSEVRRDALPFATSSISEVKEAMDALHRWRGVDRFVLMGFCSGALGALNVARADARVVGAVLINPEGYDEDVAARVHARRYWRSVGRVLVRPGRWVATIRRHASFRMMVEQLGQLLSPAPVVSGPRKEFRDLLARGVRVLIVFSSVQERGAEELETVLGVRIGELGAIAGLRIQTIGHATHDFDELHHQAQLLDAVAAWTPGAFASGAQPVLI